MYDFRRNYMRVDGKRAKSSKSFIMCDMKLLRRGRPFGLLFMICLCFFLLTACGSQKASENGADGGIKKTGQMDLKYADQFSIEYYEGGYSHIHIEDGTDYVLIPDGAEDTDLGFKNPVIIHQPTKDIYLAASSAMDFFVELDSLSDVKCCSTKASDYSVEEAKRAIESGDILYVGKYSAPDYETIISTDCNLVIESTMISHSPEIKEELERLGLPVLVERSSYESSPMGRLEWIRFYGVLLGKEKEAEDFFFEEEKKFLEIEAAIGDNSEKGRPTVAFFFVSANGYVNVRKPGDNISTMIEMAGGKYCLSELELNNENNLSTMNIDWEVFYDNAKDADILIYSSTIDGGIRTVDDLMDKNALFADFKAVKEGNVFCTNTDMFQKTGSMVEVLVDLYKIINEKEPEGLKFLFRL